MKNKRIISVILGISVFLSSISVNAADFNINRLLSTAEAQLTTDNTSTASDKQQSSIAMLNYMTVLTQEINSSANSKIYLDNVYSSIVNNINPNAVDEDSLYQIRSLLNTIYSYQSIETKRERLQYLYEQNQANAILKAVPNPMSVLNIALSGDYVKMAVSAVFLVIDSAASYETYKSEVEKEFLQENWALDDAAAESLHESRKEAFTYMVEMCQKHGLPGKLALNEKSVENFVSWKNNDNITRRIEFLEKNQDTYKAYGKYWLVLSDSYYENGDFDKCLKCIDTYEDLHIDTFRKDRDLAKALSKAVLAAQNEYSGVKYNTLAEKYANTILSNIEPEDWALRFFSAQTYYDLYARTKNKDYLQKAYDLTVENVNYLIDEQQSKNKEYTAELVKIEAKKDDPKEKKNEIKEYNKWREKERKTELPPVYQPLMLNCDFLVGLAEEIGISDTEKTKLDNMLHPKGSSLFLVQPLDDLYRFTNKADSLAPDIVFNGKKLEIPVTQVAFESTIKVTVTEGGTETVYDDWKLEKVDRKTKGDINTFNAIYESKGIGKQKYSENSSIKVEIIPPKGCSYENVEYSFKASKSKKLFVIDGIGFEMVK